MATRAQIGIYTTAHSVKMIQVAYEGYPSYTGALLKAHYNSLSKVKELMAKGNIMMLEENLEAIEQDSLIKTTKDERLVTNLGALESDVMVDYTYLFKEEDKTWYILSQGKLVKCYL